MHNLGQNICRFFITISIHHNWNKTSSQVSKGIKTYVEGKQKNSTWSLNCSWNWRQAPSQPPKQKISCKTFPKQKHYRNIFNLIFWLCLQYLVQDCMKKHTLISNWTQSAWVTFSVKPQFPIKSQNNFELKPSTRQEHCQKSAVKHFHKKLTNSISWNCQQYFVQNSRAESVNDAPTD